MWDAENRVYNGGKYRINSPEGSQEIASLIRATSAQLSTDRTRLYFVSVPRVADGVDVGPDKQSRIDSYNVILRDIVQKNPDRFSLIDLANYVCGTENLGCPDFTVDGDRFRPTDGHHYSGVGSKSVSEFLLSHLN